MLRSLVFKRYVSGGYHGTNQVTLPRRPLKKIRLGKARPAIYHQFEVQVELSDGSVITRRSQVPKNEIRLIQDQRNNPLWNPSRDDLAVVDANAGGRMDKFKQKYDSIFSLEVESPVKKAPEDKKIDKHAINDTKAAEAVEAEEDEFGMDDYLSLLNDDSRQVQSGGKMATKKKDKK
ncbi:LAFE_0D09494g1_1 [Lachancea fermentati]|uniref:LAFE_0D09494g1_1 n=1 Tax=Lachancea fermentati TaxID=4955 RepID=A0A1G4MBL3_LACFM|nr:LAFE_0D09494g1_1 [Lachancea fermentati]